MFHSSPFSYSINDTSVKFVEYHSDLGLTIDWDLKFFCHVSSNVLSVGGLDTNIMNCTLNWSSEFIISLFVTHKRPQLEYGSCLWNVD